MHRVLLLVPALALGLAACDFAAVETAVDDFNIILGIESQSTVVAGLLVDAATGDLVEAPVTLTYAPSAPGAVVDGFGDPIDGATVEGGVFNFAISDAVAPSPSRGVQVAVTVHAEGYLPQRRTIALADTGAYSLRVRLFSPEHPPAGTAVQSGTTSASASAGTQAPVTVTADPATGGSSATVTVPEGTTFRNASGQPVGGDVEVRVMSFTPGSEAFEALPDPDAPGVVQLGAAAISIRAGSRPAAPASGSAIEATLRFRSGVVHPATGRPLAEGDRVDLTALDPASGMWISVGEGTLRRADASRPRAAGEATRSASVENLEVVFDGSDIGAVDCFDADGDPYCSTYLAASVESDTEQIEVTVQRNGNTGAVPITITTANGTEEGQIAAGASSVTLEVAVGTSRTDVYATLRGMAVPAADPTTCNPCSISLPAPPEPVQITLRPVCAQPGQQVYVTDMPTFTLSARAEGTSEWFSAANHAAEITRRDDGSLASIHASSTDLRPGVTYDIRSSYLDETYEHVYTVPANGVIDETFEVPSSLCQ